jgi:hypothetical protein
MASLDVVLFDRFIGALSVGFLVVSTGGATVGGDKSDAEEDEFDADDDEEDVDDTLSIDLGEANGSLFSR